MPYRAQNAVPVAASFTEAATFLWPSNSPGATKLDCFVNGTDVVVQLLEEPGGWQQDQSQEILLRQGFNSREFPTPFIGWRFRVWDGTLLAASGTVDMAAMS